MFIWMLFFETLEGFAIVCRDIDSLVGDRHGCGFVIPEERDLLEVVERVNAILGEKVIHRHQIARCGMDIIKSKGNIFPLLY